MRGFLRALIVLGVAFLIQMGLAQLWSEADRYVDVLLVPVVLYGLGHEQRSAMLVGCASGILRDSWFEVGVFGINGFKRTLLGWILGAVATRFDLDQSGGRFVVGGLVAIGDDLLDMLLRGLVDQHPHLPSPWELVVRALVTGLLAVAAGAILDRGDRSRAVRRLA